jgi:DNA-binding response OmpR family regulator
MKTSREQSSSKRFRVLVFEDEMLLAMLVEDSLADCGCDVVGPVARVADGVKLASCEKLDGAILDINIAGTEVSPLASELARRSIPFIFVSGFDSHNLPEAWRGRPILKKPFRPRDLGGAAIISTRINWIADQRRSRSRNALVSCDSRPAAL